LIEFLRRQPVPFRIAPFFSMFFPNTTELVRLEDIRAHFGSEASYRELMSRFDPSSGAISTVILFNSLHANLKDPILALLNVRYLYEADIDIIRWSVYGGTVPAEWAQEQPLLLLPGQVMQRTVTIDDQPIYALEFDALVQRASGSHPSLEIVMKRPETGETLFARTYPAAELRKMPKLYLPVWAHARLGNAVTVAIRSRGLRVQLPRGLARAGESPLAFGRVKTPIVQSHMFPEGPLYQNLGELPRHFAVWNLRTMSDPELLKLVDAEFATDAFVETPHPELEAKLAAIHPSRRKVRFRLLKYHGSEHVIETDSRVPFLLATSEKLTPELRVEVDGKRVAPIEINWMFAGVPVEPGVHRIRLIRRIGGSWWWASAIGLIGTLTTAVVETRRRKA
ncbi:MAG TPA: hypothetical protein VIL97_03035, partial [Thermoanaerobaculia bacterium]